MIISRSQAEVAMLLGAVYGTNVSRYENFTRMPGAVTILAFEIVFIHSITGKPIKMPGDGA